MSQELLPSVSLRSALASLPGWQIDARANELVKEVRFGSYSAGIQFVNQVAALAEQENHHPDMLVQWRRVTLRLSTHDSGGLTAIDLALAAKIDAL